MIKLNTTAIKQSLVLTSHWLQRYAVVSLTVATGILLSIAIISIESALLAPMDQDTYETELSTLDVTTFDQDIIQQIVELTSRDVDIRAQFPEDRNNPFLGY